MNSSGTCVAANWVYEPRRVDAHDVGEWYDVYIQLWNESQGGSQGYRYFDLSSFNVKRDAMDLWVLWNDDNWYVLHDLGPGVVNLSGWADGIKEAQIGSDSGYSSIDDVIIGQVY